MQAQAAKLHLLLRTSLALRNGLSTAVIAMERVAPTAEQAKYKGGGTRGSEQPKYLGGVLGVAE